MRVQNTKYLQAWLAPILNKLDAINILCFWVFNVSWLQIKIYYIILISKILEILFEVIWLGEWKISARTNNMKAILGNLRVTFEPKVYGIINLFTGGVYIWKFMNIESSTFPLASVINNLTVQYQSHQSVLQSCYQWETALATSKR